MDRLLDGRSLDQRLNLLLYGDVRMFNQIPYNAVGTGVGPVGLCKYMLILIAGIHVIDYAPRIIDLCISEPIAIVPFPYGLYIFLQSIIPEHLLYFLLRKTEMFSICL